MAITFPRVPQVAVGDPIASKQLAALAAAFNARLRSGLGDPTYRLAYWADSIARQIRNSDGGYLFPSRSEWLEVFSTIDPKDFEWPETGPGDPEGTNVSSVMGEYVFGLLANETDPEDDRLLGVEMWSIDHPPATPTERWNVAKKQRGAFDPATGAIGCPVFDAARQHYRMTRSLTSPHGNSYGGFIPTPAISTTPCTDGDSEFPASTNYEIFFTSLKTPGLEKHYPGTCPKVHGHVAFVYESVPFAYYVGTWVNDDINPPTTVILPGDILPLSDWIEGPYSGGNQLAKQHGDHLPRVLNYFSAQFRGTPDQRIKKNVWNDYAFDTQEFFTRQYLLAPAIGQTVPEGIAAIYPAHERLGVASIAAATFLPAKVGGSTTHFVAQKCVVASFWIEATKLTNSPRIDIHVDGAVVASTTLEPTRMSDVVVLELAAPAGKSVKIEVATLATFSDSAATTGIKAEMAEIMEYKPVSHDHFLFLRMAGCRVDLFNGTDGYGLDEAASRIMGDDYFRWGLIQNVRGYASPPGSLSTINFNAVHEAARRMMRCIRILRPDQLTGYEVSGGKSILYFNRWTTGAGGGDPVYGPGGSPPSENEVQSGDIIADVRYQVWAPAPITENDYVTYDGKDYYPKDKTKPKDPETDIIRGTAQTAFDAWGNCKVFIIRTYMMDSGLAGLTGDTLSGIAPNPTAIPVGSIRWGRLYQVKATSGSITYNSVSYNNGQQFTGIKSQVVYSATGDAEVFEADGIKHVAEPQSFTNEWLVGFQFKGFNSNEESIWKPDAYGRYFSFSERCLFYPHPNFLSRPEFGQARWHYAYGSRFWLSPEAPTSHRYAFDLNEILCDDADQVCKDQRLAFYRSCRIFEPDLEIEKAELTSASGEVKVTLKSRLHSHPSAAASFGRDPNTWNSSALRTESFRSVDNALREWLYFKTTGINPSIKIGDAAYGSPVFAGFDAPYGTVLPHIFLTQLIPSPYTDANDTQDESDTPFWHDTMAQAEMYLRVICEGYVDGRTSAQYGCDSNIQAIYDYTFSNLCMDAFAYRWIYPIPSVSTSLTPAIDTRPDKPMGHGPVPNLKASSEVFNLFARAINKLDTVRIMLPYSFEQRYHNGEIEMSVDAVQADGTGRECSVQPSFPGVIWTGAPPEPPLNEVTEWVETYAADSGIIAEFIHDNNSPQRLVCDGTKWVIHGSRSNSDFRWKLVDPDSLEAIPPAWRDMVNTDGSFVARISTTISKSKFTPVLPPGSDCNGTNSWWPTGDGKYLDTENPETTSTVECRIISNGGSIAAPPLGTQSLAAGYSLGACTSVMTNFVALEPIPTNGIAMTIPVV